MATPDKHALLSASSAERWMACPASARLTEGMPDTTSDFAKAGTLAHSIGELKLRKQFLAGIGAKKYKTALDALKADPLYDPEMAFTTDAYAEYIEQLFLSYPSVPYLAVEKQVDFSDFVLEGFGTSDCIIIGNGVMDVVDYKHGAGVPVSAYENPQMKLYGLGALMYYRQFYTVDTIRLHVFQPRVSGADCWELSRDELIDWAVHTLRPVAKEAFEGSENYAVGEHCRFCKARAQCRAQAEVYTALSDFGDKKPPLLTNEELGQILVVGKGLKKWIDALEEYSLSALLAGELIPGWKIVAGRSVRAFDDLDSAFATLVDSGVDEALLYERKPLSLAQTEKALGKAKFNELVGEHIVTPVGKPALVPESDKRPVYNTAAEDFKINP